MEPGFIGFYLRKSTFYSFRDTTLYPFQKLMIGIRNKNFRKLKFKFAKNKPSVLSQGRLSEREFPEVLTYITKDNYKG